MAWCLPPATSWRGKSTRERGNKGKGDTGEERSWTRPVLVVGAAAVSWWRPSDTAATEWGGKWVGHGCAGLRRGRSKSATSGRGARLLDREGGRGKDGSEGMHWLGEGVEEDRARRSRDGRRPGGGGGGTNPLDFRVAA